jgi:hypothetical protein
LVKEPAGVDAADAAEGKDKQQQRIDQVPPHRLRGGRGTKWATEVRSEASRGKCSS